MQGKGFTPPEKLTPEALERFERMYGPTGVGKPFAIDFSKAIPDPGWEPTWRAMVAMHDANEDRAPAFTTRDMSPGEHVTLCALLGSSKPASEFVGRLIMPHDLGEIAPDEEA